MPRTEEVTPFFIRNQKGEGFYVDTLKEALEEFLGDYGYTLKFSTNEKELVIRRTSLWIKGDANQKEGWAFLAYREFFNADEMEAYDDSNWPG